ncbi:MAG: bacillithiol biosynthesis cysteine-adding enzyme BshC [Flavobacteriaceae bacterium]
MKKSTSTHTTISFKDTGYFNAIMVDYLDKKKVSKSFYQNFPDLEGFKNQIILKSKSFKNQSRPVLVAALEVQYNNVTTSKATQNNIESLKNKNTFTVTTGHQLNLFTGPLYFLYKIVSAINLAKKLKSNFPDKDFVPVYWMATEDHDFEEINYFNFKGEKIKWTHPFSTGVGRLNNDGLEAVFETFSKILGNNKKATYLKDLFEKAYLEHNTLAEATFYLANTLFKDYGLIIIDADKPALKSLFKDAIKDELLNKTCYKTVSESAQKLANLNYKVQVNPRDINLFYLIDDLRSRLVFENNLYKVLDTDISFTKEAILKEVDNHPERFSPNVLMRPLYQEIILPNLCYIGGGGELAYWFEMKSYFEACNVAFPILLLRNSVLIYNKFQKKKLEKLGLTIIDLFLEQQQLVDKTVKDISDLEIDFSNQKKQIQKMFSDLKVLSDKTDKSFLGAVKAQEHKQLKGLSVLEKRLLKAQKRKYNELVNRVVSIQNQLFPNKSLQERVLNFSELYLEYGDDLIPELVNNLDPLALEFSLIEF